MSALLFIFVLLLAPTLSLCASLRTFRNCLPSDVPFHLPASSAYMALKSQSFVTTFAKPLAFVRVKTEFHVSVAIKCARKAKLRVCPRSGGHSFTGASLCPGILIDLQDMRSVQLEPGNVLKIAAGANMGEILWNAWTGGRRWFASGLCPSVGASGYITGGGHGPYEGRLGVACDTLVSVRMVDRFGQIVIASKKKHPELFWAMCGAGGGQFGVVTSFRLRTASSLPFDKAVVFRFNWPHERIGELMEKWQDYGQANGDVWFRMETYLATTAGATGMDGWGACYNVASTTECFNKLKKGAFFNTPGRKTLFLSEADNAMDVHAFLGPDGNWGKVHAPDIRRAFLEQRHTTGGEANERAFQSTFLKKNITGRKKPSKEFWQKLADFCSRPGLESIPWVVCQLNLFNNAINRRRNNAFAHREADMITQYIIGGGSNADKKSAYGWMKRHLRPYTTGVYVNYPELQLGKTYGQMYWGKNLERLKNIKKAYDPELFFMNPQPIPRQ